MSPKLYRVIYPVPDIETAVAFFRLVLRLTGERVSPGRHYFDLGGTILAVYDPAADGDEVAEWKHHPNQYIYIAVRDLEAALARAREAGAVVLGPGIEEMPWGERLVYARDPLGGPFCLVDDATLFTGN